MNCYNEYLKKKIISIQEALDKYTALQIDMANGAQSYSLDTGQSKQSVSNIDAKDLNEIILSLENQLQMTCVKLYGGGGTQMVPSW